MTKEQIERAVLLYYDDIFRYFVFRFRDRTRAEDLTQETFLHFVRGGGRARWEGERRVRAYLYRIASRVAADFCRGITDCAELNESVPAPAEEHDTALALEAALAALPDPQREAAILYYYAGLRVREIAQIQHVSVSAVKSRMEAARNNLKKLLSEEEFS